MPTKVRPKVPGGPKDLRAFVETFGQAGSSAPGQPHLLMGPRSTTRRPGPLNVTKHPIWPDLHLHTPTSHDMDLPVETPHCAPSREGAKGTLRAREEPSRENYR